MAQGLSARVQGLLAVLALCHAVAVAAPACPAADTLVLQPLAAGVWWLPGRGNEADADNRGQVSNLLLVQDGPRLWALGAGPTPAFGVRLRCAALRQLGRPVSDLVAPWAHPELVLGARGLAPRRHWAHQQVALAMRRSCADCSARLRRQLGAAGDDVGDLPARLPDRRLRGLHGRLGPFDWWLLSRGDDRVATLWRHRASGIVTAHGLAWGDGPPDLRDAEPVTLAGSLDRAASLVPAPARWVGEQGALMDSAAVAAQARYLVRLAAAADAAVAAGGVLPPAPPLDDDATAGATQRGRHQLNWQRAVRLAEDRFMR